MKRALSSLSHISEPSRLLWEASARWKKLEASTFRRLLRPSTFTNTCPSPCLPLQLIKSRILLLSYWSRSQAGYERERSITPQTRDNVYQFSNSTHSYLRKTRLLLHSFWKVITVSDLGTKCVPCTFHIVGSKIEVTTSLIYSIHPRPPLSTALTINIIYHTEFTFFATRIVLVALTAFLVIPSFVLTPLPPFTWPLARYGH